MVRIRHWKELAVFLCVVGFTLVSISRNLSYPNRSNELSRIATTFVIVENGTFAIDGYQELTADWSSHGGHFYSNKAPLPALLATPAYYLQYRLESLLGMPTDTIPARMDALQVAKFFTTTLPTLFALALLFHVLIRRFRLPPLTAFGVCAAWAIGSLSLVYSVMFFGHQTAAAFLGIAICLTILEFGRATPRPALIGAAGLAAGLSVGSDYIAAVPVLAWTIWLIARTASLKRRKAFLAAWVLGGAVPAMLLMSYHYACFGNPFTTPYSPDVINGTFVHLNALSTFDPKRLFAITFSPWRGLFFATPVWIFTFVGLAQLVKGTGLADRSELLAAAAAWILLWAYFSMLPSSYGGWCIGPRYIVTVLPMAALLLIEPAKQFPRTFLILLVISSMMMLLAVLVDPLPDERLANPWIDRLLPMLAFDEPLGQWNLLRHAARLNLIQAMAGYLVIWTLTGLWLWKRLSRYRSVAASSMA